MALFLRLTLVSSGADDVPRKEETNVPGLPTLRVNKTILLAREVERPRGSMTNTRPTPRARPTDPSPTLVRLGVERSKRCPPLRMSPEVE